MRISSPWLELIGFLAGVALLFFVIFTFVAVWEKMTCDNFADESGRNTEWRLIGGCYVDVGGGHFIPTDNYRGTEPVP